ncbi:MAG: DUF2238 domain-containing protein [Alcanivorax sp.]|nr:DUF2238 domain-containing protein [Alcanivorax sp.]
MDKHVAMEHPLPHATAERRYALTLLALFWLCWLPLAIAPWYRQDWLLENALVFIGLPLVIAGWRRYRFSRGAITALFLFALLHIVGAHYTYAQVPYNDGFRALFGSGPNDWLGLHRNHFDRLVHMLFGLLFMPLLTELFAQKPGLNRRWQALFAVCVVLAISALYEILEWWAAVQFGGSLGQAYLGTQGDVWDAQKDMAMAGLGALLGAPWVMRRNLDTGQ